MEIGSGWQRAGKTNEFGQPLPTDNLVFLADTWLNSSGASWYDLGEQGKQDLLNSAWRYQEARRREKGPLSFLTKPEFAIPAILSAGASAGLAGGVGALDAGTSATKAFVSSLGKSVLREGTVGGGFKGTSFESKDEPGQLDKPKGNKLPVSDVIRAGDILLGQSGTQTGVPARSRGNQLPTADKTRAGGTLQGQAGTQTGPAKETVAKKETTGEKEAPEEKEGGGIPPILSRGLGLAASLLLTPRVPRPMPASGPTTGVPGSPSRPGEQRRIISRASFGAGGVQGLGRGREFGFTQGRSNVPRQAATALLTAKRKSRGRAGGAVA